MIMEEQEEGGDRTPDWAHRAEYIDYKPEWVDHIPHELWELGEVFFPLPYKKKGHNYPHHLDSKRYAADSEVLNGYLECSSNYGIACANDLAVVDVDEPEYVEYIMSSLPSTLWQVTGSREGTHLFYKVPDLDSRKILRVPHPPSHKYAEGLTSDKTSSRHIGEIKCDSHGYVVGPGSVHPSGNKYGPLQGDEIATVDKDDMLDSLSWCINDTIREAKHIVEMERQDENERGESKYNFYNLQADDVIGWLEAGKRVPHPVHGSSTGTNFMKSEDEEVFICWRHDYGGSQGCALNPQQLLAVMATKEQCDVVRAEWDRDPSLHYHAWKKAVSKGLVSAKSVPYRVAKGYAVSENWIDIDEEINSKLYWDSVNAARCVAMDELIKFTPPD